MRLLQPDSSIKYLLYCFLFVQIRKIFFACLLQSTSKNKKKQLKNQFKRDLSLSQMKIKVIIIIEQEICVKQLKLLFIILDLAKLCSQQKILVFCLKFKKKTKQSSIILKYIARKKHFLQVYTYNCYDLLHLFLSFSA